MAWRERHPALAAMHLWGVAGAAFVGFCLAVTPVYLARIGGGASDLGREVIEAESCEGRLGVTRTESALILQPRVNRACRERLAAPALRVGAATHALKTPHPRWRVRLAPDSDPARVALIDQRAPDAAPAALWPLPAFNAPARTGETSSQEGQAS